jgi:hypothetical protein
MAPRQRRVASALARAFEYAGRDRDNVPLGVRFSAIGVEIDRVGDFIDKVNETGIPESATRNAIASLRDGLANDPDPEIEKVVAAMLSMVGDAESVEGLRMLLRQTSNFAAFEGFVVGVAYVHETLRGQANRVDRRRRGRPPR